MERKLFSAFICSLFAAVIYLVFIDPNIKEGEDMLKNIKVDKWINVENFSLSSNSDKIIILEFWASWCDPCMSFIPHIRAWHDEYKDKGVVFISLTAEKDYEMIKQFCSENRMNWAIGTGYESVKRYCKGYPQAFVIVNGKIKWQGHPIGPLIDDMYKAIKKYADSK